MLVVLLERTVQLLALLEDPSMEHDGETMEAWLVGMLTFMMPAEVGKRGV